MFLLKKLISVIVPLFNLEFSVVEKCVKSLINQDYTDFEIIMVDDGSEKFYSEQYDILSNMDSRITLVHTENCGVSHARNAGIEISKGEYITFVDGDDWVNTNFLSLLISNLEKYNADISVVGIAYDYIFSEDIKMNVENTTLLFDKNDFYKEILFSTDVGGYLWNKLFKKKLIKRYLDESLHLCEDFEFLADYLQNIDVAVCTSEKAYHYLQKKIDFKSLSAFNRKKMSLLYAREKVKDIYAVHLPECVFELEKSILKVALNLKACYKISASNDKEAYKIILNYINKYYKKIIFSKNITMFEKFNVFFTKNFPKISLRVKIFCKRCKQKI